jgi:hypothetical protein
LDTHFDPLRKRWIPRFAGLITKDDNLAVGCLLAGKA